MTSLPVRHVSHSQGTLDMGLLLLLNGIIFNTKNFSHGVTQSSLHTTNSHPSLANFASLYGLLCKGKISI